MLVVCTSSVIINESTPKAPLVFSNWPPVQRSSKPQSLRHQILYHLRSNGRIPTPVKRYPSPPRVLRPIKMSALPLPTKGQILQAPSYYRPTISTQPRYRFRSSAPAPNTGEYVFENPFTSVGIQQGLQALPVRIGKTSFFL